MRTGLFLLSGFLFLAASLILGKLFSANYPGGTTVASFSSTAAAKRWSSSSLAEVTTR